MRESKKGGTGEFGLEGTWEKKYSQKFISGEHSPHSIQKA
jgi:hypothetical protein